ncbi:thiol peroxidase [Aeromicrobium sp. UC242_57]|uniref:thiol peroxidase n=1 Tax=Aeromicrobium sp. UC242_57 TaxID=3374624 RepID=UPI0037B7C416
MTSTAFGGTPVALSGDLPTVGSAAPAFTLTAPDLSDLERTDGRRTVLNIFPSVDTGVCAASVRKFNELAAGLDETDVINVSVDLPFAMARFCGAEGIENAKVGSAFRSSFGQDYGVTLAEGAFSGLLARLVVVLDRDGSVLHSALVPEIGQEPDYDSAVASLS